MQGKLKKKKKEKRNWYEYIPDITWTVLILKKKIFVDLEFKLIGCPVFNLETV